MTATDPYDSYAAMRARPLISWSEEHRGFLVTRHADVAACLRHPALSSAITATALRRSPLDVVATFGAVMERQLDLMDPPRHTALRRLLARAFDAAQLERLRRFTAHWVQRRVRDLPAAFDLMTEIAHPLPLQVVLELLGLPAEHREEVRRNVDHFVDGLSNPGSDHSSAAVALATVRNRLADALDRGDLDEGGLLAIVRREETAEFGLDDLLANVILTIAAGHQTTSHLIGNGAWLLLAHDGQRSLVAGRSGGWDTAIEEILRFESPVQTVRRVSTQSIELFGLPIAAGAEVVLGLGAANRDVQVFEDADQFDVLRRPNPHLAFGLAAHHCLGAQLARMQAKAALTALLALSSLHAVEATPVWTTSTAYRGLERLNVEWSPQE